MTGRASSETDRQRGEGIKEQEFGEEKEEESEEKLFSKQTLHVGNWDGEIVEKRVDGVFIVLSLGE